MFFKKRREKMLGLQVSVIVNDIRETGNRLNNAIKFILDYGNMTKRKNHKLKQNDFMKNRDQILGMAAPFCTALTIVMGSKRLTRKYRKLMLAINNSFENTIRKAREKTIEKQVKENIVKQEDK